MRNSKRIRKRPYITHSVRSNTVFGYTEPGAGKKKFECQDTYSIIDIPEDHIKYYAVYDGHGNVGRQVIPIAKLNVLGITAGERLRG